MSCVSSSTILVLFNFFLGGGGVGVLWLLPIFQGIRQGDLLFPYLFILCMEVLGFFIVESVKLSFGTRLRQCKEWFPSPMCFSEEILVFLWKLIGKTVLLLGMCLTLFMLSQVKKINSVNFWVFFSPNVLIQDREGFCDIGLSLYPWPWESKPPFLKILILLWKESKLKSSSSLKRSSPLIHWKIDPYSIYYVHHF